MMDNVQFQYGTSVIADWQVLTWNALSH